MNGRFLLSLLGAVALASPATATDRGEIGYPEGALGYDALVAADYSTAEAQLRAVNRVERDDPARLINLGRVFAKTGRADQAAQLFRRTIALEDVELILANGEQVSSRAAARRALRALTATSIGSR